QVQVLEEAAARFVAAVFTPALDAPRGERRIRAVFRNWLGWSEKVGLPGGCIFVQAAVELDDREGPAREALVRNQIAWKDALARAARLAMEVGDFRADLDPDQFAHELYGIVLGHHHAARLLRDPGARARTERSFETLLERAR